MTEDLAQIRQEYVQRTELYARYGYDIEKERAALIRLAQPLKGRILEVGCGRGYLTLCLAQQGVRIISIDADVQSIDNARRLVAANGLEAWVDLRVQDVRQLSFATESFDIIFCANVVHHFEQAQKAVQEMLRVIKANGKLIISDLNQAGMELVAQIHRAQGGHHRFGKTVLRDVACICEQQACVVKNAATALQDILLIQKKP